MVNKTIFISSLYIIYNVWFDRGKNNFFFLVSWVISKNNYVMRSNARYVYLFLNKMISQLQILYNIIIIVP